MQLDDGIESFVSLRPDAYEKQTQGFRTWSNTGDEDAVPVYQSMFMFNIVRRTAQHTPQQRRRGVGRIEAKERRQL